jgi:hypothetical protein
LYASRKKRNCYWSGSAQTGDEFSMVCSGKSASLEDYTQSYLQPFNLIYLIEPEVKDFGKFQNSVSKLADSGKLSLYQWAGLKPGLI